MTDQQTIAAARADFDKMRTWMPTSNGYKRNWFNAHAEARAELRSRMCEPCSGSGEINDADPGDIMYNTWRCTTCKGTGFNPDA